MAFAPKIPMGPEALPRQWLYLIPLLPDAPQGWQIHVGGNLPGLTWPIPPGLDPELMPPAGGFFFCRGCQLCWGSGSGRQGMGPYWWLFSITA